MLEPDPPEGVLQSNSDHNRRRAPASPLSISSVLSKSLAHELQLDYPGKHCQPFLSPAVLHSWGTTSPLSSERPKEFKPWNTNNLMGHKFSSPDAGEERCM